MLSATESGAKVASAFTTGNVAADGIVGDIFNNKDFEVHRDVLSFPGDPSAIVQEVTLPMLVAEGVTKVLRCEILNTSHKLSTTDGLVEVGDHVLVLAKVSDILEPPIERHAPSKTDQDGLCYANGKYRKHGEIIQI